MNNKFKEVGIKNHTYYLFDDIINIKIFDPNKVIQTYSYLLHWISDNQKFEILKN